jgi:hypothetical protein
MRKALNENPLVQAAILGVLGIFVAFMLITRVFGGEEAPPPAPPPTASSASTAGAAPSTGETAPSSAPAAPASESAAPAPESGAPATESAAPAPTAPEAGSAAASAAAQAGRFVAGPGLPQKVVTAYAKGKAVALYVYRRKGVDDVYGRLNFVLLRALRNENLEDKVAMFTTNAHHIARYSRIAEGVDVSRVPALVVIKPRKLTNDQPVATVSYGYQGPGSIIQAVEDALYKGRDDVPYYPE